MTKLTEKILGKIKKEKIKPLPKWHFLLKKSFIWSFFGGSVVLGGIAFSGALFQLNNITWEFHRDVSSSLVGFIFMILPYFWGILLILFLASAYYNFKHTETGYRHNIFWIAGLSILISLLFGSGLYASGITDKIEENFQRIPLYQQMHLKRMQIWNQVERGLLSGKILKIEDNQMLLLEDLEKKEWNVDIRSANIPEQVNLRAENEVRIKGEKIDANNFKAAAVRPMIRGGMMQRGQFQNKNRMVPRQEIREELRQENLNNLKMKESFPNMRTR